MRARWPSLYLILLTLVCTATAQELKTDWKFPARGVKSHYDAELKTRVYDLGDGFTAARLKMDKAEVVMVSLPGSAENTVGKIEEADLALVIAEKCVRLPKLMKDVRLERERDYEHRFRTASGGVVKVVLAHDRKTAVVRLEPVEMQ